MENFKETDNLNSSLKLVAKIPNGVLSKCIEIPKEGVLFEKFAIRREYNPYKNNENLDFIGIYNTIEGTTSFVNTDGKVYIAKGNWIINILKNANFKPNPNFSVPYGNVTFLNNQFRDKFNRLPQN